MDWQVFGHENIKKILEKQLETGVFPHAYLFSGQEGLGKKALALELARRVLGAENLTSHPDFQLLDQPGEIVMETALAFIERLSLKPMVANYTVAVLDHAENLNPQSSNALLKTLEEPSSHTIIILIAGSGSLLSTIASRCQLFNFNVLSEDRLRDLCASQKIAPQKELLDLSFGRPGLLIKMAREPEFLARQKELVATYQSLARAGRGEKFARVGEFAGLENEELKEKFLAWLFWQYYQLKNDPGAFLKVRALSEAVEELNKNFNKKLVLQNLFLKI